MRYNFLCIYLSNLLQFLMISKFHKDFCGYFHVRFMFTYWNVYHFYMTSVFARGKKNTKLILTVGKYLIVLALRITSLFPFDIFTFSRCLHSYIAVTPISALCILVKLFANYAYRFLIKYLQCSRLWWSYWHASFRINSLLDISISHVAV